MPGEVLAERLSHVPRVPLAVLPTPIQSLPRLSAALGGPRLSVVRDDLTGLAFGGNKVRQLEFLLAPAVASRATVLVAGGGARQSNHARVCAGAARVLGMRSVVLVRPGSELDGRTGNALLMELLADEVRVVPELDGLPTDRLLELEARRAAFEAVAEELHGRGERPFVLLGSSLPLAVLAYVNAFLEIMATAAGVGPIPDVLCVTSQGATHAGLALAARLVDSPCRVIGFAYSPTDGAGAGWVADLANRGAREIGLEAGLDASDITHDDAVAGPGYGKASPAVQEAIWLAADTEGLLVDPVYTAKGLAGLIGRVRAGDFRSDAHVAFVHTGGLPALFAHPDLLRRDRSRHLEEPNT